MKVLNLARIDASVFKGHSSRSAALSGAELAETSISDIQVCAYGLTNQFSKSIIISQY